MTKIFAPRLRHLIIILFLALPAVSFAQDAAKGIQIVVEKPWARASLGTSRPGGAYLILRNEGDAPVSLTGMQADIAGMISIHETKTTSDGISSMAPAGNIVIPAGGTVALEPGGYHAMLMQLQSPLTKGETFPLTLTFSDGTKLEINVPVLGIGARGPEG